MPIPAELDKRVRDAMRTAEFESLYAHQAQAIVDLNAGRNVVLATGTGSGKSLVFWAAAAHRIVQEPMARVLAIFPTKALAQDQVKQFEAWVTPEIARIGILDADTKRSHRPVIRQSSHVIVTNPDMLHIGILPGHETWSKFFRSLRMIVIDEVHSYTGVFGAHVAGILSRLLRLAHWHGSNPVIVCASATVLDPAGHAARLTGQEFVAITSDTGRKFERRIFVLPSAQYDLRAVAAWLGRSVIEGCKTLAFSQSRQAAERLTMQARDYLHKEGYPVDWIDTYRSGLAAKDRRKIEGNIRSGKILGISATSALELGVDIGSLDRVLLNGYPGSHASLWQQIGRVGRSQTGEAYFLPKMDVLDEYVGRSFGELRDQPLETSPLAIENPHIVRSQLRCAAFERALSLDEVGAFSPIGELVASSMVAEGELVKQHGRFYYPSHSNPAPKISIRGTGGKQVKLQSGPIDLGTLEISRALREAHVGAIYLHRGEKYRVTSLNLEAGHAELELDNDAVTTEAIVQHIVSPQIGIATNGPFRLTGVAATTLVTGYRSADSPKTIPLELPPESFDSIGILIHLGPGIVTGAIHGAEHVLIAAATLIAGCHPNDLISTWSIPSEEDAGMLVLFDSAAGGNGISQAAFAELERWLATATEILKSCPCEIGCPRCLLSSRCPYSNEWLDKPATLELLHRWTIEF